MMKLIISLGISQLLLITKANERAETKINNHVFGKHYWIVESSTIVPALDVDMDGIPDTNLLIMQETCERDDADFFREDGVILTHWGEMLCDDEEEEISETGTWKFNNEKQLLTIKKDHSRKLMEAKLVKKTSNQLVFSSNHKSSKSDHVITLKLKRKL